MPTLRRQSSTATAMIVGRPGLIARVLLTTHAAIITQLYSIPPWAAAFVFSMIVAFLSDKLRHRFLFTMIPMIIAMAGIGVLLNIHGKDNRNTQYGALFMLTCGCYSAMPVIVCWFAMNLGGHRRRSVGTAWQIGFGNSKLLHFPRNTSLTGYSRRNHLDVCF